MVSIDLNSDLGESFGPWPMGDDSAMLDLVSSANIACGFHAGDPAGILSVIREAMSRRVVIGAHVGYRDLVGFGRRAMEPSSAELIGDVIYQIGALQGLAKAAGTSIHYVKPHGALYNTIANDARQASDVIAAIKAIDPELTLLALAGAPIVQQARQAGLRVVCEAFADRAYSADGSLVNRRLPGAVIHDPEVIAKRMLRLVKDRVIESIDGVVITIEADSICIHGDNATSVATARVLKEAFIANGVHIASFIPGVNGGGRE
jgi:5-oxoprolinase (ATP-hydrolysing) subunit A